MFPFRKMVTRVLYSTISIETLECGHDNRLVRSADRRGVPRWYDGQGRITSVYANKRRCRQCPPSDRGL